MSPVRSIIGTGRAEKSGAMSIMPPTRSVSRTRIKKISTALTITSHQGS